MAAGVVGASATGIPGLAGIGMGIQERNFSALGTSVGVSGVGQNLCLSTTGSAGLGNPSLLPGGLGTMSNTQAGLGTSGLGTPLGGGLGGTGLSLGTSAVGGSAGLGYNDYDRSFDRADDGYRNSRSSDTIIVRNVSKFYVTDAHLFFLLNSISAPQTCFFLLYFLYFKKARIIFYFFCHFSRALRFQTSFADCYVVFNRLNFLSPLPFFLEGGGGCE